MAGVSVLGQWFSKRRGLAVGVAGSGLGQFGYAPSTQLLFNALGWRSTLQVLGIVNFTGLAICSMAIRRRLPKIAGATRVCSMSYWKDNTFIMLYLALMLSTIGYTMPFVHIVKYALLHGISTSNSVLLLAFVDISSAFGRAAWGQVVDKTSVLQSFRACMLLGGLCTVLWTLCKTFDLLVAYSVAFGFFGGVAFPLFVEQVEVDTGHLYTHS